MRLSSYRMSWVSTTDGGSTPAGRRLSTSNSSDLLDGLFDSYSLLEESPGEDDGGTGDGAPASASPHGGEKVCFRFGGVQCALANPCCDVDLTKVEFHVGNDCWGAVQYAEVNGARRSVAYARYLWRGERQTTMKLSNLGFASAAAAHGSTVCFQLRESATCATAARLCDTSGGVPNGYPTPACKYSLFNTAQDCCPTSLTSLLG
eukprot:23157-Chlamydomonas_euryale.AAC.1